MQSGLMVAGYDCWDKKFSNHTAGAAGAFVSSMNESQTRFHSSGIIHNDAMELCTKLKASFDNGLEAFKKENGTYPGAIIFYRNCVGKSEIDRVPEVRLRCCLGEIQSPIYFH